RWRRNRAARTECGLLCKKGKGVGRRSGRTKGGFRRRTNSIKRYFTDDCWGTDDWRVAFDERCDCTSNSEFYEKLAAYGCHFCRNLNDTRIRIKKYYRK